LTLRGRSEEKVRLHAEHLRRELDRAVGHWPGVVLSGPAPSPLARAESLYRYQVMIRCRQMSRLVRELDKVATGLTLPPETYLAVDVDPVNLS